MIWNYFDSIKCINLKSREDRYNRSKKMFAKHNIPVVYHRVDKHPNGGLQGCFESHIDVIKEAYEKGCERLIVFEDDIESTVHMTSLNMRKIIRFLKKTDWDLFYLGPHPEIRRYTIKKTDISNIYKLHSICTHSYIINRPFMEKLIHTKFVGLPIDYLYKFNEKAYGYLPSLFIQGASESDISGDIFNKYPILKIGSIKFIELYATIINIKLPYFIAFVIVFLFILVKFIGNTSILILLFLILSFMLLLLVFCK